MKKLFKNILRFLPLKQQFFSVLRVFPIPEKTYRHLYFTGVIKLKIEKQSFKMKHYGFQLENELFWAGLNGGWEKESIQIWTTLCKQAKVILDVGANTGVFALIAETINPEAEVIAFEPVNRVFDKLQKNVALNQMNVHCRETALSNYDGEATIYDLPGEHIYSVTVNQDYNDPSQNSFPVQIKTERLDTIIDDIQLPRIDLMKIDVETHEAEVLEGMGKYLEIYQPTLLIELLNDEVANKVQKVIQEIPYLYFNIDEITGVSSAFELKKSTGFNYLICTENVAKDLKLI